MSDFQGAIPPPLTVSDFSGGITDNFLDAPTNRYETATNLLIKDNKKPITRPGTNLYDVNNSITRIPAGNARVTTELTHEEVFFLNSGRNVYYKDVTLQTLLGPTGNLGLSSGIASVNFTSFGTWNGHLMMTSDVFGSPMKIYKDSTGTQRVVNAGLPSVTLTGAIAQANDLKSIFNTHINDAAEHTGPGGADSGNTIATADAEDLQTLITLVIALQTNYPLHDADAELASPDHHAGQETMDHSLTVTAAPQLLGESIIALDDIFSSYNGHDADTFAHTTGSTHQATVVNTLL